MTFAEHSCILCLNSTSNLLLNILPIVCGDSVLFIVFGVHYFVSFLVLQSSWIGRKSWLLYFYCLTDVLLLQMFCGSSSWCRGLVCGMWLWYFLIILTYFLLLVTVVHVRIKLYSRHVNWHRYLSFMYKWSLPSGLELSIAYTKGP